MKRISAAAIAFFGFVHFSFSQDITTTKIETEIHGVTVFITGGEIHRKASVNIKQGRNKLVFTEISTVADNKSVQFSANKPYNLVSVSSEIDYLSRAKNNPRIEVLVDSVKIIGDKITQLENEKSAYFEEKQLLTKNNLIKGEQENLSVEELKAMAEYYRKRMMELYKIINKYDLDINDLYTEKYRYQNQLSELNYKETVKSNQIIVIIDSDEATKMDINLKYIVSNCGWQANYDLSAPDVNGSIHLKYKAKVFNNTGNDWKDVNMVLSTSDPNISASAPELSPWYLNYESLATSDFDNRNKDVYMVPQNREYTQYYQNANVPQMSQNLDAVTTWDANGNAGFANTGGDFGAGTTAPVSFTTIEVSQLSTEFKIDQKYSVPSDSKPYLVDIKEIDVEATFSHKAVPKLDRDAFLLANIIGWEQLELVPGPTNVYFADTYVGQSYINTRNVGDTLRLSFGRDNKIIVNRKLLEEFSSKQVIGSNKKDTYTYEITVKNNRSIPIKMNLFDQVPISQTSDITVSVDDISGAERDETTGKLTWKVNLAPGESVKYKVSFTIKYPKDKKIEVKKFRTISCPSF